MEINDRHIVLDADAYLGHWAFGQLTSSEAIDPSVKLYFAGDDDIRPLMGAKVRVGKGKNEPGKRYRVLMIEVGDDDQPVNQTNLERYDNERSGPACQEAIEYCQAPLFQQFMVDVGVAEKATAHYAKKGLCHTCRIVTRKALDHDPGALALYRTLVAHYRDWLKDNYPERSVS